MRPENQFLIAIPTRNRAETVLKSLPSLDPLLGLKDVRIVLSDNSDEPSSKVREYCEAKGIDWMRPEAVSTMTAHWNWILESQKYKAITMMTDRTWLMADVWLQAKEIAESTSHGVCWAAGTFNARAIPGLRFGILSASAMTGKRYDFPLERMDFFLRENHVLPFLPKLLNSITFSREFEEIKSCFGSGLNSVAPDFEYAYLHCYANARKRMTFLDRLGIVTHSKELSNGGGIDSGLTNAAAKDFLRLTGLKRFEFAPFPDELDSVNGVAHELNLVLHRIGKEPFVTKDVVRTVRGAQKKQVSRSGLSRYWRTAAALVGLTQSTVLKLRLTDRVDSLRNLSINYAGSLPHILDEFEIR